MELLRNVAAYERSKKKRDEKIYLFVRKQQFGKVERNVYAKVHKLPGGDTKKLEYVKYNGKYMQLVNYKDLMKKKNLYKSLHRLSFVSRTIFRWHRGTYT